MQADTEYHLHLQINSSSNNRFHFNNFFNHFLDKLFRFQFKTQMYSYVDSYAYIISFIQIYVLHENVSDNF